MLIAARSSQDFACCWRATAECALEIRFRFRRIRLWRHQRDLASGPIEFRFVARFLSCFHRRQPLANTSAPIGEWLRTEGRYLAS